MMTYLILCIVIPLLYVWKDIRAGIIKKCSNDLKNVAKDGIGCIVFCVICFIAAFVNFLFMGVNL